MRFDIFAKARTLIAYVTFFCFKLFGKVERIPQKDNITKEEETRRSTVQIVRDEGETKKADEGDPFKRELVLLNTRSPLSLISFERFGCFLQCFTPTDLHNFDGSPVSKTLNSSEFAEVSPVIVYCLLPAREKNSGQERCEVSPRNHSELFNSFARNFSQGQQGITHEALDRILEEINKTIGEFLTAKKVGDSAAEITHRSLPGILGVFCTHINF